MFRQVTARLSRLDCIPNTTIRPVQCLVATSHLPYRPIASSSYSSAVQTTTTDTEARQHASADPPPRTLHPSPLTTERTSTAESETLKQDIDEFFAGFASESSPHSPAQTFHSSDDPKVAKLDSRPSMPRFLLGDDERPSFGSEAKEEGPVPFPVARFVSAVRIIQRLLQDHGFLSTQDMWKLATEGFRPILQPGYMLQRDGSVKMKKTATMREGKRLWVPPRTAPLPDHPFKSVTFLKSTICSSLEAQSLIHKSMEVRPIETDEETQASWKRAEKLSRRAERNAVKEGHAPPEPYVPSTEVHGYGWRLGPHPQFLETNPGAADWGEDEARWNRAERMEEQFHRAKAMEALQIAERQRIRREDYRLEKQQNRAQREEDNRTGQTEILRKERSRMEALANIERYAKITGEDVSGWYEELAQGELGEVPIFRPGRITRVQGGATPNLNKYTSRRRSGFGLS